jgi:hypothetical protein
MGVVQLLSRGATPFADSGRATRTGFLAGNPHLTEH